MSIMLIKSNGTRRFAARLLPVAAALIAAGCAESGLETGPLQLGQNTGQNTGQKSSENAESWTTETTKGDKPAPAKFSVRQAEATLSPETASAIKDARALRQAGNKSRALGILEKTTASDKDPALLLERGLLTLELGQVEKAVELLKSAHNPAAPDWRQHSGLGTALSAHGKQQEAQAEFAKALHLAPDNPSVLNNLALSYALDGKHSEAERILRTVSDEKTGTPQAKQNLALILGLRGNVEEARKVSESVLPPDKVKANVAYLEGMNSPPEKVSRAEQPAVDDMIRAARALPREGKGDKPVSEMGLTTAN